MCLYKALLEFVLTAPFSVECCGIMYVGLEDRVAFSGPAQQVAGDVT